MNVKKHNGWTNYETWCVKLWLDNEEGSYHEAREIAQAAWDQAEGDEVFTEEENARIALADRLKELHEDANPLSGKPSVFSDLLGAALSEVNWHEIAQAYLDDDVATRVDKDE